MLARAIDAEPLGPRSVVLDLCSGSGVLAIRAALRGAGEVWAVDVSRRAVLATRAGARLNGVRVHAVRGDLFGPVAGRRFELIVSNPPYVPGPEERLPTRGLTRAWEAGPRGRAFLDRICDHAHEHLLPGGRILLVHSSLCSETETTARLNEHGLRARVIARYRGPLGPLLRARAEWLRSQALLSDALEEEIVIVRAERPALTQPSSGERATGSDRRGRPGAIRGNSSPPASEPHPRQPDGRAGTRLPSGATPS
jgi:release factor glutamine methyltransferase